MKLDILEPTADCRSTATGSVAGLIADLQWLGLRLDDPAAGVAGRRGGAGPSDHKAVTVAGRTVMVPVHTHAAGASPFVARPAGPDGRSVLERDGRPVSLVSFPPPPRFYARRTADGVPYWKIAVLHAADVLATTVLQTCVRYQDRATTCQFCAIGQSLAVGRTVARKTPPQLAEVARAAVELDGVRHMVMTTGTPNQTDRGARVLCESAAAVSGAVPGLPVQAQCEPPDDAGWFARLRDAGVAALGMHLEAVEPATRARVMPGKATVPVDVYFDAFAAAVAVFGRGQVSTYILAGLGDSAAAIVAACDRLIALGVYPFVVPFVPIAGTPLESHPAPPAAFMRPLLRDLGGKLAAAGMTARDLKAGCGRCGACSSLSAYEDAAATVPGDAAVAVPGDAADLRAGGGRVIRCLLEPGRPARPPAVTGRFRVVAAAEPWQVRAYFALRRSVFCGEQRLFAGTDRDAADAAAVPIVAVSADAVVADDAVVGTVRVHEASPGVWFGSRLAVDPDWRGLPALAPALIRAAVTTALGRGCHTFLAHVQPANVPLFRRLRWHPLEVVTVCGRPHRLMRADPSRYRPTGPGAA